MALSRAYCLSDILGLRQNSFVNYVFKGLGFVKSFEVYGQFRIQIRQWDCQYSTKDPSTNTHNVAAFQLNHLHSAPLGFSSPNSALASLKPKAQNTHLKSLHSCALRSELPAALVATFWLVSGDQGSSLGLVLRYALSLSCFGTVISVLSIFSASFWMRHDVPFLSVAIDGCP